MNREIKFRAWDGKQMTVDFELSSNGAIWTPHNDSQVFWDWPLMQFTGLKDKNGKEIYEGDVVREHPNCVCDYIVGFVRGHFTLKHTQSAYNKLGIWNVHDNLEVIGNIYENPELLTN